MNIQPGKSAPRSRRALPNELKKRADQLYTNPDAYPFPSHSKVIKGEPDQVNFERAWDLFSDPHHWTDDTYHNDMQMNDLGDPETHKNAWFDMSHSAFPLMPTVFGTQDYSGVVVESKVEGTAGKRVGTIALAELNRSDKSGWQSMPEHLQLLTVTEMEPGQIGLELGVKTAPSESPEWLRKGFLVPWATWHIEIDEADKMRHLEHRLVGSGEISPNPIRKKTAIGAVGGAIAGAVLASNSLVGGVVGAAVGGALSYYFAGENIRNS